MRAIIMGLLALCLSACGDETKYEQGYADALQKNDAYVTQMQKINTDVQLCHSEKWIIAVYAKHFVQCDVIVTPELVKKSKDFGLLYSYWFIAVTLPICLIAIFSLTALTLFFIFLIKISELRIIKLEKEAYVTHYKLTETSKKLANLEKKSQQQQADHANQLENASKTAIAAFKASEEYIPHKLPQTVLKSDDDAKLAALLKKAQAEHPDFEF